MPQNAKKIAMSLFQFLPRQQLQTRTRIKLNHHSAKSYSLPNQFLRKRSDHCILRSSSFFFNSSFEVIQNTSNIFSLSRVIHNKLIQAYQQSGMRSKR